MAIDDDLTVTIKLRELRQFIGDTERARTQVQKVAGATEKSGTTAERASRSHGILAGRLKLLAGAAAGAFGAFQAVQFIRGTITAASDLGEQINKNRVVFRGSEKQVLRWSATLADSFGISQRQALEFAGVFGNMLVPMGFARGEAAKMSQGLVELSADMASFNNASPKEVLEALRSGLSGETEPLRRFGIFLNDARIKQEAMRLGLIKQGEELTAAAKAQAIYNIIQRDTKDAHGDFARTGGSLANLQRRLAANWENLQATLGKALLPYMTRLVAWVNRLVVGFRKGTGTGGQIRSVLEGVRDGIVDVYHAGQDVIEFLQNWKRQWDEGNPKVVVATTAIIALVSALGTLIILNKVIMLFKAARVAMIALSASMYANPIGLLVGGIAALIAILVIAYRRVGWFRDGVNAVWSWIKDYWPLLAGILTGGLVPAIILIVRNFDRIRSTVADVVDFVRSKFGALVGFIAGLPGKFVQAGLAMGRGLANAVIYGLNKVIDGLNSTLEFTIDPPGPGSIHIDSPNIPAIPYLAMGGRALTPGLAIVGDAGPELAYMPQGATIQPLSGPNGLDLDGIGGPMEFHFEIPVTIDGREVGRAVDQYTLDRAARR